MLHYNFQYNETFFKNIVWWTCTLTCPILGPLTPLFWISGDVSSEFQIQSDLPYSCCRGKNSVYSSGCGSGATDADLVDVRLAVNQVSFSHTVATEVRLPGCGKYDEIIHH